MNGVNGADTAWMLVATALVLLMTPALGLFYAGFVRSKNTLNTFMMSASALGVVTVVWALIGYSIAFAPGNDLIGGLGHAVMNGVGFDAREGTTIPHLVFFAYQATFAIVTGALISGAVVERMRFVPFLVFMALWTVLVYAVLVHWVWGSGWLADQHVLDFAGGVPVEIASGFSAWAAAIVVGARRDHGRQALLPHNAMFILLGAGLLWFGWFGFNGGSGYGLGRTGILAFTNTLLAPAATLTVWFILDLVRERRVTAVGGATAVVVGCVGITPAAGYNSPVWALALGGLAAIPSYVLIMWRPRTRLDESLDVLAAHGVGGVTGILFIGLFAQRSWNGLADGLVYGNPSQLAHQALAVVAAVAYAFVVSYILFRVIGLFTRLRVDEHEEAVGLDVMQHGEEAYASGEGAILVTHEEDFFTELTGGRAQGG